jgi:hypothetical protein
MLPGLFRFGFRRAAVGAFLALALLGSLFHASLPACCVHSCCPGTVELGMNFDAPDAAAPVSHAPMAAPLLAVVAVLLLVVAPGFSGSLALPVPLVSARRRPPSRALLRSWIV